MSLLFPGNDKIHAITNQDSYAVRIDLQRMNGETAFAMYDTFYIEDEEQNYRLHILDYSGTASKPSPIYIMCYADLIEHAAIDFNSYTLKKTLINSNSSWTKRWGEQSVRHLPCMQ